MGWLRALDPDIGVIRWHYQFTPHDLWDYDGVNENILFDHDGRKLLGHFDANGHLFILDRQTGELQRVAPFYRNMRFNRRAHREGEREPQTHGAGY